MTDPTFPSGLAALVVVLVPPLVAFVAYLASEAGEDRKREEGFASRLDKGGE